MSEQQPEAPPASSETPTAEPIHLPDDHPLVKTLAAQKEAIRDLKARSQRLDEFEESQKTEAQKSADRLTQAEQRATQAEAKATRRDIAIEHKLGKEDAELLDALTDEDAMRRLAGRLATASEDKRKTHVVPGEGKTPSITSGDADRRAFVRRLTGQE